MRYETIQQPDAIRWIDDDYNSGIAHPGEPEWDDYQAWLADGGVPSPIGGGQAQPTLEVARAAAIERLKVAADEAVQPIMSPYPSSEVGSWPVQLAEAKAWLVDPTASTSLIDSARGDTDKTLFCQTIVAKADAFSVASGTVFAWRRACTDWIVVTVDVDALMAWQPIYPEVPNAAD